MHKLEVYSLEKEEIYLFAKANPLMNNVVIGIKKECFTLGVSDGKNNTLDFQLIYINGEHGISGYIIILNSSKKTLNSDLLSFCKFIQEKYINVNSIEAFNTYQNYIRSTFEQEGYFTFTNETDNPFKYPNATIMFKGSDFKGVKYTPLLNNDGSVFDFDKEEIEKKQAQKNKIEGKNDKMTYVYLMLNNHNGRYKIGRSSTPEKRERTLQSEEPDIQLIAKTLASPNLETFLHRKFKSKNIRGEWFSLDEIDVAEILTIFEKEEKKNLRKN